MNRAELTNKMLATKRESPCGLASKSDASDLFDRSLRRAMEDKEAPTEIEEGDGQVFEQCDMAAKILQQPVRNRRMVFDSEGEKKLLGMLEGGRDQPGSTTLMPEHSFVEQKDVWGNKRERDVLSSPLSGALITAGSPVAAAGDGGVPQGSGSTMSAVSYRDFSRVLQQQVRETGAGVSREWRFSFQDARLPLAQIKLISQPSGSWGVTLASNGIDRETLARRLDELHIKLAKLNRNIEGVEIVKGRFR